MFKVVCSLVLSAIITSPVAIAKVNNVPVKNKYSYNEKVILERYGKYIDLIHQASNKSGMDMEEIAAFVKVESTFNNKAINNQFKAKGLYQHLDSTWVRQKRLYAKKMGVAPSANVYNAKASLLIGSAALAAERVALAKHSNLRPSQIKSGDLYLSHMYGYDRALKIIKAPKGTKISKFVKINPSSGLSFYKGKRIMTTHEFRTAANAKMEREKRLFISKTKSYKIAKTHKPKKVKLTKNAKLAKNNKNKKMGKITKLTKVNNKKVKVGRAVKTTKVKTIKSVAKTNKGVVVALNEK